MRSKKIAFRLGWLALCLLSLGAIVGATVLLKAPTASAATARPANLGMQEGFLAHTVQARPITKKVGPEQSAKLKKPLVAGTSTVLFPCQSDTNPEPILCYGPQQIEQAYGMQKVFQRGITGKGSTIVLIDAFGSTSIQGDLKAFDAAWGLSDPTLNVLVPFGGEQDDQNWSTETTLDVEWSHVMAPDAAITLVVAPSNSDVDLYKTIKYAVDQNLGDVISLSFGENESCMDPNLLTAEHQVFQEAASKGISVLASSGDLGSAQFTCDGSSFETAVSFPASDPLVTSVGGTSLTADATTGQYIGETAWNESAIFNSASGGGYSVIFPRPDYQANATGTTPGRAVPDLALNASIDGGVLVYQADPFSGQESILIAGGTSVAAPELAGIIADGVQMAHHRLGFLNRGLYALGKSPLALTAFNDILSGNNILFSSGIPGYTVRQGWSAVTGWGTPKAGFLLGLLITHIHSNDAKGL